MKVEIFEKDQIVPDEWNLGIENPTQLFEFANTGGKFSIPYFLIIKDKDIIFKWQFFVIGFRYFRYINIVSEPNIQTTELLDIAFKEILREFNPFKVIFYSITLSKFTNMDFLELNNFNEIYRYGSSVLDLTQNEDVIFSNIHSKHRNVIKKAQKEDVGVFEDTSEQGIYDFYKIGVETYARSNKEALEIAYLLKYFFALNKTGNIKIFFAKKDNVIQAGAIFLVSKHMSIYWHGASINNCATGSSNLLQWEAIKYFKQNGTKIYDFGGCSDLDEKAKSISRFKSRFGGMTFNYIGFIKINNILKNMLFIFIKNFTNKG